MLLASFGESEEMQAKVQCEELDKEWLTFLYLSQIECKFQVRA